MSDNQPSRSRARVIVSGQVQGVWFRASTLEEAQRRQLTGWVRNLANGDVEAVFEGPRAAVEEMITWCRHGPAAARVDFCDVIWEQPTGEPPFEIRT